MPWDSDSAKEAQRKAVESRRRRKELSVEDRVKLRASEDAELAMKDIIDCAHARGDFEGVDLSLRVRALTTVLAYGAGRPQTGQKAAPTKDDDELSEDIQLV